MLVLLTFLLSAVMTPRKKFQLIGIWTVQVIVPRGNWTRLIDMVDELHRNYSAAAYVFRNNYFFLDLPPATDETVNVTFVRYRRKVCMDS